MGFRKYGHVYEEPQRHEDTKKAGNQSSFNAGFLCVFVSLWFLVKRYRNYETQYLVAEGLNVPLHDCSWNPGFLREFEDYFGRGFKVLAIFCPELGSQET
jgi:hypothetical protein